MNHLLNPNLFQRLQNRFGDVRIENEGYAGYDRGGIDPVTLRPRHSGQGGEEYIIRCPFCADEKGHLYINHRYGLVDPETGFDNTGLAHCFRRECLKDPSRRRELAEMILSLMPHGFGKDDRISMSPIAEGEVQPCRAMEVPCGLVALSSLPAQHKAREFLTQRGFDLVELEHFWDIAYCVMPCWYDKMLGRIYVPVWMQGELAGWQGRYAGDLDWGQTQIPKYYNAPGMHKSRLLYNYDEALKRPLVVVVEGVTDAWKVGSCAVALFGKSASQEQVRLLAAGWYRKPIIILLDPDAAAEAEKLRHQLAGFRPDQVVVIHLPVGMDPGDCPRDALWDFLRKEARARALNCRPTL